MERFRFIVENFNYTEKLKELYNEHAYTHHSGGIGVLPVTFYCACFILSLLTHQSISFLEVADIRALHSKHSASYHLLEFSIGSFPFFSIETC